MEIRKLKIEEINPAPYNPRKTLKPGDAAYESLLKSVEQYGYVQVLVMNSKTGNLVAGHQGLSVMKALGYKEVDVRIVDLDLKSEKALNIALNKITGEWDDVKLAEILDELSHSPEIDIVSTGFDLPEISEVIDRANDTGEDDYDVEADVESIKEAITKEGDLILLGDHRLLCGHSDNPADVDLLMNGEKINLVFTDPPYSVGYYGGNRPHANARPKKCKSWEVVYQDNLSQPDYEKMLKGVFSNMARYLAPGSAFYIWNGHLQFGPMHLMLRELGYHVSTVIVWAKPNFSISFGDYHQQVEFCLYGWKEDNGAHFWAGPVNESTLWEYKRDSANELVHPTQKPTGLAQRAIRNSSKIGDLVVDFFGGSGSCMVAAESLGRRCFLMEAEKKHCDAITRRFIKLAPHKVSDEIKSKYMIGESNG